MSDVKSKSTDQAKDQLSNSSDEELAPCSKPPWGSYQSKTEAFFDISATSIMETNPRHDRDPRLVRDRMLMSQRPGRSADGNPQSFPLYLGHMLSEDDNGPRYGPHQAPQNIRSTARWDYAPDICLKYKETGTCELGDSCKFLHKKSDSKFGLQLDEMDLIDGEDIENFEIYECEPTEDELPETCNVCREYFRDPVKSECDHYFCETCFKNPVWRKKRCPICALTLKKYACEATDLMQHLKTKGASAIAVA